MTGWRLLIVGLMIVGGGCSRTPPAPTYQLTGQILVVKHDTNQVLVKHEDIPGFMPAMTMPYAVKDPALNEKLVTSGNYASFQDSAAFGATIERERASFGEIIKKADIKV